MSKNTKVSYMYRDGSNYKQCETVVIAGSLDEEGKKVILDALDEGSYFIPSQVGLVDLQERMIGFPNDDDHVWHELAEQDIEPTDAEPTTDHHIKDMAELVQRFKEVSWDINSATQELGIKEGQ